VGVNNSLTDKQTM